MDFMLSNTAKQKPTQRNVIQWRPGFLNSIVDTTVSKTKDTVKKLDRSWETVVNIVLVEAKCLPPVPDDGVSHTLSCKLRLGSESCRSKSVPSSQNPQWKERFRLHLYQNWVLNISLRDEGKMKNPMGSCVLDLSKYEKERTHEIWQQLDDGYGAIHVSVTMCAICSPDNTSNSFVDLRECVISHKILNNPQDWTLVGILHVHVLGAKGLISKSNVYCTLEIDNESVETNRAATSSEPRWNKCYVFKVYDVTSTLDVKVYDGSLKNVFLHESIGKVSIPLLRISNGVIRSYALKDKRKRSNAKGNCPRIKLQMSLAWNPIKATVRLFQAKEVKHIKKPPKFDLALVYSNTKYIADLFNLLVEVNEYYKHVFEWDDREYSFCTLIGWLVFCYYLRLWAIPLLLLIPFLYQWIFGKNQDNVSIVQDCANDDENKEEKTVGGRIQDLQTMTLTITNGIDFIVSYKERLLNLFTFKVPFLSVIAMILLLVSSVGLYFIPINYFLMSLGIYKFGRKYSNPDRVLNNGLIDFLSRVPDSRKLKDWKELGVPEPNQEYQRQSFKIFRSISTPNLR
ncbi:multiple C2 and transmembrane domain-containing protein-like [Pararge aegeria]|uniref:multiple C2 and transmembrane domain-containing protein-like n=1 Tax=Pararge aegeria TaxID=116150 RepID=UPI0019D018AB|nr:multiple C2 and transmembrane domain-containing protein-like [Pararge aegeria]